MDRTNGSSIVRYVSIGLVVYVLLLCIPLVIRAENASFWLDEA